MSQAASTAVSGIDYGTQSRGSPLVMVVVIGAVLLFVVWLFTSKK